MVEKYTSTNPNKPSGLPEIYYAGSSQRRTRFLQQALSTVGNIISIGGGEEEDTGDVQKIMTEKVHYASELLNSKKAPIVAADARTEISVLKDGKEEFISKGKPKSPEVVRENLGAMSRVSEEKGYGYYRVVAASGTFFPPSIFFPEESFIKDELQCNVTLYQEALRELSTPKGFEEYLARFKEFYDSDVYQKSSSHTVRVSDLSGGISLPVLASMGAVRSIDGIPFRLDNPEEEKQVYDALFFGIYTVAVGFSPLVLTAMHPLISDEILNWEWLHEVTKLTLEAYKRRA